jgi:hypothetical protein
MGYFEFWFLELRPMAAMEAEVIEFSVVRNAVLRS